LIKRSWKWEIEASPRFLLGFSEPQQSAAASVTALDGLAAFSGGGYTFSMTMFSRPSIADLYRRNLELAKEEIMSAPDRRVAETDTEDLVEYCYSKYKLTPIAIDGARQPEAVYKKRIQVVEPPAHPVFK
jgi:hypothetical protein